MAFFRRYELVLGFLLGLAVCVVAIVYSENYKTDNQSYQTTNRHGGALSAEERIANYT
jgi:hypothetical protein